LATLHHISWRNTIPKRTFFAFQGKSMQKQVFKPVMFRLREDDKARLLRFCHRSRMSQSVVMHNALRRYLDENESTAERVERLKAPA
jgi:hypothetical protein